MAEFKAQILGILLVLSVFGVLLGSYKSLTESTVDNVSNKVNEILTEEVSSELSYNNKNLSYIY